MKSTILYLVRHAQSHPKLELTEPEWPLSERGVRQATEIVPRLMEFAVDEVYSSPYSRCVDTITPFCRKAGKEVRIVSDLRERKISLGWIDDFTDIWRRSWEDFSYALPGAESSAACQKRMLDAVTRITARHEGKILAVSGHGNAIGLFLNAIAADYGIEEASVMRNPDIYRVVRTEDGFRLDKDFRTGAAFDELATNVSETPGVKT